MTPDIETIVVGAGAIGLAAARALVQAGHEVMVLEQHALIGSETSSRNSEVIHAGIYYPQGSVRARMCVAGKHQLYRFAEENGVPYKRIGKLLVATDEAQNGKLEDIRQTAARNGVDDLVHVSIEDAKAMEPALFCTGALHSPSTGIIDSHAFMSALEGHIEAGGGQVVLNTIINAIAHTNDLFCLDTVSSGEAMAITCRHLVMAAGLNGTRLGRTLHGSGASNGTGYRVPETYPAKGHYFSYSGRAPFSRLIYPIPDGAWLGIHLSLDMAGQAKFGPDLEWIDTVDYAFDDPDGERQKTFTREVRRYWPGLADDALQADYTGIRPKLYQKGEPAADFTIHGPRDHGIANLIGLYGIESPGLTSSLAIADHVAELIGA